MLKKSEIGLISYAAQYHYTLLSKIYHFEKDWVKLKYFLLFTNIKGTLWRCWFTKISYNSWCISLTSDWKHKKILLQNPYRSKVGFCRKNCLIIFHQMFSAFVSFWIANEFYKQIWYRKLDKINIFTRVFSK